MSLNLRTLSLLLLRNSKVLTSNYSSSLTQVARTQPICCRLRDINVYTRVNLGNSAVLQGHESGNTDEAVESREGLTLSDSCVKVTSMSMDLILEAMFQMCYIYNSICNFILTLATFENDRGRARSCFESAGGRWRLLWLSIQD